MELTEQKKQIILKLAEFVLNSDYEMTLDLGSKNMPTFYLRNNGKILFHHYFFSHYEDWQREYDICMINVKHHIKILEELKEFEENHAANQTHSN